MQISLQMAHITHRQWLTLIVMSVADFCNAICISLQAPFYPQEAERKGCSASEYGVVFGIFELIVFLVSPLYGQYLNKIGPKVTFNGGIYTTGICAILFGLLDKVDGHYPFIILSFVIRIVEALGNAAFSTASFAIIAHEFPDNVATTFACLETFFGLGMIAGPTVGAFLYQVGGYTLPFAVMGSALLTAGILTGLLLPKHENGTDRNIGPSMLKALKIPGVLLSSFSIVLTSMSIGFLQASLEPHLRPFMLQPVVLGLMFVINGGVYAITAPGYGWLCDHIPSPKIITALGAVLIAIGFCLIGPASFLPMETTISVTIVGLVMHGLGIAAQLVSSFSNALKTTVAHGFPNNLDTFGVVSGLWTSSFALGSFIGPSVSGILYDNIGFRNATVLIFMLHLLLGVIIALFICFFDEGPAYVEIEEEKQNSTTESMQSIQCVDNGKSIEKSMLPGMDSFATCNSDHSQAWHKKEASSLMLGAQSYGATDTHQNQNKSIASLQSIA